jgi:amidase
MAGNRAVHAFSDDALGEHDAVGLAELIRRGEVGSREVAAAALERARLLDPTLHAVEFTADEPVTGSSAGLLSGVPTYVKDNTDIAGWPTGHGSAAFVPHSARRNGPFARQLLATGVVALGKSRLPEFGFNATTEFMTAAPTRNPWHLEYSSGASSGGAAALVAAGVVPIAHANDGGGSIRIPAACCGLVGLKPSRGRHIDGDQAHSLPVNIISEGVVTRSVRDTAHFSAALERAWRNPALPPLGLVEGPANRRLRIGLLVDSVAGVRSCSHTNNAVRQVANALAGMGHDVEPATFPVGDEFVRDFMLYWGLLAFLASATGKHVLDRSFDSDEMDGLQCR